MPPIHRLRLLLAGSLLMAAQAPSIAQPALPPGCSGTPVLTQAGPGAVLAQVRARGLQVLSFFGYSGAGYEDPAAMLAQAARILDVEDPARVLVNAGGTADGIGAVYALARARGFATLGIVSTLARTHGVALSPCVQQVFIVPDSSWGGRLADGTATPAGSLPGLAGLAPTSQAMVAASDRLVAIGGGEIARDELLAAQAAGKPVQFHPADLQHAAAIDKARRQGLPAPTDFRGAAHAALRPD